MVHEQSSFAFRFKTVKGVGSLRLSMTVIQSVYRSTHCPWSAETTILGRHTRHLPTYILLIQLQLALRLVLCCCWFHHSDELHSASCRQRVNPRVWLRAYERASDWLMWRSKIYGHSNFVSCCQHYGAYNDLSKGCTNNKRGLFLRAPVRSVGSMTVLELYETQRGALLEKDHHRLNLASVPGR